MTPTIVFKKLAIIIDLVCGYGSWEDRDYDAGDDDKDHVVPIIVNAIFVTKDRRQNGTSLMWNCVYHTQHKISSRETSTGRLNYQMYYTTKPRL